MYTPKHFQENDQHTLFKMVSTIQMANLITQHTSGLMATFLPLYLEKTQGQQGTLYGHIAKANQQGQQSLTTSEVLAIFTGPDAYITPSWYPSKKIHHKEVPTWNYVTIQVRGTIEFTNDHDTLQTIVTKLTNTNEKNQQTPWQISDAPNDYIQAMLKAIIGVKITITEIKGKYKLSQNKTPEDQQGIIQGLATSNNPKNQQIANLILKKTNDTD